MARPSKYNDKIPGRVLDYLSEWMHEDAVPSIEGLADYLDINKSTIYEWEHRHQEFSHVLEKVRNRQVRTLFNHGLRGDYNATLAKLMLTKHGYSDKVEQSSTIEFPQLDIDEVDRYLTDHGIDPDSIQ